MTESIGTEALSQILSDMHLVGGVFLDAEFSAPWCIVSQVEAEDCKPFMAMPPYLIAYHYVVEGELIAEVDGSEIKASAGQILLLPRNDYHLLSSEPGLTPANAADLIEPGELGEVARIRYGGGGARTRILCGFLGTDTGHNPVLSSLPTVISLDLNVDQTAKWVEESIRYLMRGLATGGQTAVGNLNRLAELLFVEAVRTYAERLPVDGRGWLNGLKDPLVAKALALLHGESKRQWTLAELAGETATSRSVLTDHFARTIGMGPIEYDRRRRLGRAAERLSLTNRTIGEIGFEAGYGSEATFSRSFKRTFGKSPGAYRSSMR